jgi:hypothetical protein
MFGDKKLFLGSITLWDLIGEKLIYAELEIRDGT